MSFEELDSRRKKEFPIEAKLELGLRLRRAMSWYERSLVETEDPDAQFIFCWIAFNSAYGIDSIGSYSPNQSEKKYDLELQEEYFSEIAKLDTERRILYSIMDDIEGSIHSLLSNEFIYREYWAYTIGTRDRWAQGFETSKLEIERHFDNEDTAALLKIVFERLYVLRNQILHGNATWKSTVNRSQVEDGAKIISTILPLLLDTMMSGRDVDWGSPGYPVIQTTS